MTTTTVLDAWKVCQRLAQAHHEAVGAARRERLSGAAR